MESWALRVSDNVSDIPESNEHWYNFTLTFLKRLTLLRVYWEKAGHDFYSSNRPHPILRLPVASLSEIKIQSATFQHSASGEW